MLTGSREAQRGKRDVIPATSPCLCAGEQTLIDASARFIFIGGN